MDSFVRRAAFYFAEINAIHPFREGNGRAQREFIRELGEEAGFSIDWSRTTQARMLAASQESFSTRDSSTLTQLIRSCIA